MRGNKRLQILLVIGLLVLATLACEFSAGGGGEPGVTSITTCKAVDSDQKCEGQANSFNGTETIYASVQAENLSEGDRVTARWFQGTNQVQEFTFTMDQSGSGFISFSLIPEGTLPAGDYAVQVFLNDNLAQTANFQVEGEAAAAVPPTQAPAADTPAPTEPPAATVDVTQAVGSVTTCTAVDAEFRCAEPATTFAPEDTIYASVEIVDAPADVVISARWFQGSDLIDEATFDVEAGGAGFIAFDLTPDQALPPGDYAVEIYAADTLVEQVALLVEGAAAVTPAEPAAGWQTHDSETWVLSLDYPATWQLSEDDESLFIFGGNKTIFYLTGYTGAGAADEENQAAVQSALDNLAGQFSDFQSTAVEPFRVGGVDGLTSDYAYTDNDGDFLYGSVLAGTSESGNTYLIFIEALADEYEPALNDFNGILQTLVFK